MFRQNIHSHVILFVICPNTLLRNTLRRSITMRTEKRIITTLSHSRDLDIKTYAHFDKNHSNYNEEMRTVLCNCF